MAIKNVVADEIKPCVENEAVYISNNPRLINVYSVYLNQEISEPKHYRDLFNMLRDSTPDDTFIIYLNNFGGYVHTGIDIINSMKAAAGRVFTCLSGPVYSIAPLIALQGDKVFVEENTFMMFHDYSGGMHGKGHEQEAAILNDKPFFNDFFNRMTKGFLTKKEQNDTVNGKDIYLKRADIMKRLDKMGKLGNAKRK